MPQPKGLRGDLLHSLWSGFISGGRLSHLPEGISQPQSISQKQKNLYWELVWTGRELSTSPHPTLPRGTHVDQGHNPEGIGHTGPCPVLRGQPRQRPVGPRLASGCWRPRTLEAWNTEVALAVLLAGKQLASDRKGSAMRGLSSAPKPTKKWRTCGGRELGVVKAWLRLCMTPRRVPSGEPLPGSSSGWEAGGVRSEVPVPTFLLEITW